MDHTNCIKNVKTLHLHVYRRNLLKPVTKGQTKKVKDFIAIYIQVYSVHPHSHIQFEITFGTVFTRLGDTKGAAFFLLPKKHHFSAVKRLSTES
jgi:hypothetical protein